MSTHMTEQGWELAVSLFGNACRAEAARRAMIVCFWRRCTILQRTTSPGGVAGALWPVELRLEALLPTVEGWGFREFLRIADGRQRQRLPSANV